MNSELYKEIIIEWEIYNENNYLPIQNVLYCVYCDSHIYGKDVLAYIGQTTNFNERKEQHLKSYFQFANNVRFVIGILDKTINLCIPESILIANHKPFYNKQYIHDLSPEAKKDKIIIINNGNHGSLKNSVTNYWWISDKNFIENAEKDENESLS